MTEVITAGGRERLGAAQPPPIALFPPSPYSRLSSWTRHEWWTDRRELDEVNLVAFAARLLSSESWFNVRVIKRPKGAQRNKSGSISSPITDATTPITDTCVGSINFYNCSGMATRLTSSSSLRSVLRWRYQWHLMCK